MFMRLLALLLLAASLGLPQTAELTGTWSAAYGRRVFQGTWTTTPSSEADVGIGTWRVIDASGKTQVEGYWSARKINNEWYGSWRAEVSNRGGVYSGTWDSSAKLPATSRFSDLLEAAVGEVVSGVWDISSRSGGTWSIRAVRAR